jgi:hypothetical protein
MCFLVFPFVNSFHIAGSPFEHNDSDNWNKTFQILLKINVKWKDGEWFVSTDSVSISVQSLTTGLVFFDCDSILYLLLTNNSLLRRLFFRWYSSVMLMVRGRDFKMTSPMPGMLNDKEDSGVKDAADFLDQERLAGK